VDIPSYRVKPNQLIGVREKAKNLDIIIDSIDVNNFVPEYLTFDVDKMEGVYTRLLQRSELPGEINEELIVEFYSRYVKYFKSPFKCCSINFFQRAFCFFTLQYCL